MVEVIDHCKHLPCAWWFVALGRAAPVEASGAPINELEKR
jgi:hypothetical protein